nr:MAG TPA: hypothetical protein [Caudoviricetes sp.]
MRQLKCRKSATAAFPAYLGKKRINHGLVNPF